MSFVLLPSELVDDFDVNDNKFWSLSGFEFVPQSSKQKKSKRQK